MVSRNDAMVIIDIKLQQQEEEERWRWLGEGACNDCRIYGSFLFTSVHVSSHFDPSFQSSVPWSTISLSLLSLSFEYEHLAGHVFRHGE